MDHEEQLLLLGAVLVGPMVLVGLAAAGVRTLVGWGVLVAADAHPLVALPGAGGAGLDGPRLAVVAGLLVGVAAMLAGWAHARWVRSRSLQ